MSWDSMISQVAPSLNQRTLLKQKGDFKHLETKFICGSLPFPNREVGACTRPEINSRSASLSLGFFTCKWNNNHCNMLP